MTPRTRRSRLGRLLAAACGAGFVGLTAGLLVVASLLSRLAGSGSCPAPPPLAQVGITLEPGAGGVPAGATEYGGPGDPSSGVVGASGANLLVHPDSYAELGGTTFATATLMGGLPYMTPVRVSWGGRSAIAYKRDFGLGGGPIDGSPRVIDLWWQFATALGIPYENVRWSGRVRLERPPATGAAEVLGATPQLASAAPQPGGPPPSCGGATLVDLPLTPGPRATLLPDGLAAAPADAPPAVKAIIAAGNQIVGKPYLYGAAHGLPLSEIAPAYDCSSSVEHLLYGARLLPVTYGAASTELESFGAAGPGAWVTLYANPQHVFMYVAGLRWDTHDAAGPGDGSTGIGWHPLVRSSAGFVARHPVGL